MRTRSLALSLAVAAACVTLAGCSSPVDAAATPTVTVTTTTTVTATPSPTPRSPDDPVTAFDAWLLCYGATYGESHDTQTVYSYTETSASGGKTITDNGDGTFEMLVPFAPTSGKGPGAESICVAGGTIGKPTIQLKGARDFG